MPGERGMPMGSGGSPLGKDLGHCPCHVSRDLVLGFLSRSQAEHVTKPLWASVSLFVVCVWVLPLLCDASEHGLELEDLSLNPESTTFEFYVHWKVFFLLCASVPCLYSVGNDKSQGLDVFMYSKQVEQTSKCPSGRFGEKIL